jgi:hypothetical protein
MSCLCGDETKGRLSENIPETATTLRAELLPTAAGEVGRAWSGLALDPGQVEAQRNVGPIYRMGGDIPRAKACFQASLAKAPRAQYGKLIPQVQAEIAAMR